MSLQSQTKECVKRIKENPKGTKRENTGAKGSCKGKKLELGQVDNDDRSWIHEEWSFDERNDGWSSDGWTDDGNGVEWREDCEQAHVAASSFSLESSEWEKMNLHTGEAVDALSFGPEGIGGGSFHDWIPDGEAWQFQGYDENGFPRSLDGRLMDAYEVWNSSASASASTPASRVAVIACKEQQDFCVKHNAGYMIPTHSKSSQKIRVHCEKLFEKIWK